MKKGTKGSLKKTAKQKLSASENSIKRKRSGKSSKKKNIQTSVKISKDTSGIIPKPLGEKPEKSLLWNQQPNNKVAMSLRAKKMWDDPQFRNTISAKMKKHMENPKNKQKAIDGLKKYHETNKQIKNILNQLKGITDSPLIQLEQLVKTFIEEKKIKNTILLKEN